jgi:hypothetical protein
MQHHPIHHNQQNHTPRPHSNQNPQNQKVPPELARHEAAKQKPGAVTQGRDAVQFAKR